MSEQEHYGEYLFDDPWITGLVKRICEERDAATQRAGAAEAQLAAVPSKAIYDCWYHADGQTPDESVTAVEAWLVSTGVMDKYYRA